MRYEDDPIGEFLDAVASSEVAPAGGTATAVVGATGAAVCEMVCVHAGDGDEPAGEDAPAEVVALAEARTDLRDLRGRLLTLAGRDGVLVDELFATAGPPSDGADAKADMKQATGVPLAIAETTRDVLEVATTVAASATGPVLVDAGTGAYLARGALQAALFTVRCNLELVDDPSFVTEVRHRTRGIEAAADVAFDSVLQDVRDPR